MSGYFIASSSGLSREVLHEGYAVVGYPATEEALKALATKKDRLDGSASARPAPKSSFTGRNAGLSMKYDAISMLGNLGFETPNLNFWRLESMKTDRTSAQRCTSPEASHSARFRVYGALDT